MRKKVWALAVIVSGLSGGCRPKRVQSGEPSTTTASSPTTPTSSSDQAPANTSPVTTTPVTTEPLPSVVTTPTAAKAPQGCTGDITLAADDFVLYNGETLTAGTPNTLMLKNSWMGDEVWDNGRLLYEANASAITFSNEAIYHGFKLTPPQRKTFTLKGAEVYLDAVRANTAAPLPTFGLRIIKPGEDEGNGGAPTTTWMMDKPTGGSRFLSVPANCSVVKMVTPQAFLDQKAVGNRLIWEMQSNWNPADKLRIRMIVLKGFQ